MIRFSPKRTKLIRRIRTALMEQILSYNTPVEQAEAMVTQEIKEISQLPIGRVRKIAKKL